MRKYPLFILVVVALVAASFATSAAAAPKDPPTGSLEPSGPYHPYLVPDDGAVDCQVSVFVEVVGEGKSYWLQHRLEAPDSDGTPVVEQGVVRLTGGEVFFSFVNLDNQANNTFPVVYGAHLFADRRLAVELDVETIDGAFTCDPPQRQEFWLDGFSEPAGRTWTAVVSAGGYGSLENADFDMRGQFSDENGPLSGEVAADFCELSDPDTPDDPTDDIWICDWRFEGISKKTNTVTFTVIEPNPVPEGALVATDISRR